MKNSNGTIGNRTRDVPECSAVPQPNASARAPVLIVGKSFYQTRLASYLGNFDVQ